MTSTRLLLFGALFCLPAFAQYSSVAPSRDATERMTRRQHGPIKEKTEHTDGTTTSSNWSGYAVLGSAFTSASATWIVPTVNCTGVTQDQYASSWVGLDGYNSNSVEQIGTDSDCVGSSPNYYAWFEFYPAPSYLAPLPVTGGDLITASVVYNPSNGQFTLTITDNASGTFTKSSTVSNAQRSSAEWILEAPCCTHGGMLPLSNFGTANFGPSFTLEGSNEATDANITNGSISAFAPNWWVITKTASSTSPQTSTCTALFSDGASFNCTYGAPASGGGGGGHHHH